MSIFFYPRLWRARAVGWVYPGVFFPITFLDFLCTDRQVSSRKSHWACWLTTLFRFRFFKKKKNGLLIRDDPRWKSKKWPKDIVYVSSHFWLSSENCKVQISRMCRVNDHNESPFLFPIVFGTRAAGGGGAPQASWDKRGIWPKEILPGSTQPPTSRHVLSTL